MAMYGPCGARRAGELSAGESGNWSSVRLLRNFTRTDGTEEGHTVKATGANHIRNGMESGTGSEG